MTVSRLEIESKELLENGKEYGEIGTYDQIKGTVYFEVDPFSGYNERIVDIQLAPRNSDGKVEFSADFVMLTPSNSNKGNGTMFLDVVNRGNKTVLYGFNSADRPPDPTSPIESGNGFLMRVEDVQKVDDDYIHIGVVESGNIQQVNPKKFFQPKILSNKT